MTRNSSKRSHSRPTPTPDPLTELVVAEFTALHERLDGVEERLDLIDAQLDDIVGLIAKAMGATPVGEDLVLIPGDSDDE
jgi:tetrahydromethanopterin S-methyltransferase subunit G